MYMGFKTCKKKNMYDSMQAIYDAEVRSKR